MRSDVRIYTAIFLIALSAIATFIIVRNKSPKPPKVNSFQECVAAGYPVMESYPRQCRTVDGKLFFETVTETPAR